MRYKKYKRHKADCNICKYNGHDCCADMEGTCGYFKKSISQSVISIYKKIVKKKNKV